MSSSEPDSEPKTSTKKQSQETPKKKQKERTDESDNSNINPELEKIIKNSTADMWNRLRKTWIEYVNTVTEYNLKKQPLKENESQNILKITLEKEYLESNIERYLIDLGLDHSVFKKSPFLVNYKESKNE